MAIEAYVRTFVRAPPNRCFAAASDFERYECWAKAVERATVVDRKDDGRAWRVAYDASLFGKDYSATLEYDYTRAPAQLSWTLRESRKLHSMEGLLRFQPVGDDTEMTFRLRTELIKPRPARHERRAGRLAETIMSRDLRRYIERDGKM